MINYHYETGISMLNKIFIKFHRCGFSFSSDYLYALGLVRIMRVVDSTWLFCFAIV